MLTDEARNKKVAALKEIADELDVSLAQMSLAWCAKNPNVSTVITGASSAQQVRENMTALDALRTPDARDHGAHRHHQRCSPSRDPATVGLIGGLSWESTATYYRALNEGFRGASRMVPAARSSWTRSTSPESWNSSGAVTGLRPVSSSPTAPGGSSSPARRGGDMREHDAHRHRRRPSATTAAGRGRARRRGSRGVALGSTALALLGTRYLLDSDFYSNRLEELRVSASRPTARERDGIAPTHHLRRTDRGRRDDESARAPGSRWRPRVWLVAPRRGALLHRVRTLDRRGR